MGPEKQVRANQGDVTAEFKKDQQAKEHKWMAKLDTCHVKMKDIIAKTGVVPACLQGTSAQPDRGRGGAAGSEGASRASTVSAGRFEIASDPNAILCASDDDALEGETVLRPSVGADGPLLRREPEPRGKCPRTSLLDGLSARSAAGPSDDSASVLSKGGGNMARGRMSIVDGHPDRSCEDGHEEVYCNHDPARADVFVLVGGSLAILGCIGQCLV